VAAKKGRKEITAASGSNIPPRAEIRIKEAASGCGDRTKRNHSSQWLEYSATGREYRIKIEPVAAVN